MLVLLFSIALRAADPEQTAEDARFEVASVKKADPPRTGEQRGCSGGPGTSNPLTWSCPHVSLSTLIYGAYDLEPYQFEPGAITSSYFAVTARVPPMASKEGFLMMQQNLLEERFRLAFHRQLKDATVYELIVSGASVRMPLSGSESLFPETERERVPRAIIGTDGYPVFPDGVQGLMGVNGHERWRSANITIGDIVKVLRHEVRTDVIDTTALTGRYDVDMRWQQRPIEYFPAAPPFEGPDIERAIQERLGLRLIAKKGKIAVFVVDHVEKVPTEN